MNKKSFFNRQSTAVALLYCPRNMTEAASQARNAEDDGADAIALEMKDFPLELRTVENFVTIIESVQLPFMFISYRNDNFLGKDDEARQEYLLKAAEAGAEVIDVMGDLFDPSPRELTFKPEAVTKQKALIEQIHSRGAKVIMSSHIPQEELTAEEVLAHLQEQSSRGADILKLVVKIDSEEAMAEAMRTFFLLHKTLDKPYVFLAVGKYGRLMRYIGGKLGVAIEFSLHEYKDWGTPPTIRSFRKVLDNFHWDIDNIK